MHVEVGAFDSRLYHACSDSSGGHRGKVKAYYAAEGAFYTASVFMLLLWEERRKDFWAMLLHHLVTFALITASYSLS